MSESSETTYSSEGDEDTISSQNLQISQSTIPEDEEETDDDDDDDFDENSISSEYSAYKAQSSPGISHSSLTVKDRMILSKGYKASYLKKSESCPLNLLLIFVLPTAIFLPELASITLLIIH